MVRVVCLLIALALSGCAALSTNKGIRREAFQRGIVSREALVDTLVRLDTTIVLDTLVRLDTVVQVDTLVDCSGRDTVRVRYSVPVYMERRVTDTVQVAVERRVYIEGNCPEKPDSWAGVTYLTWARAMLTAALVFGLVAYWLARRK